MLKKVLSFTLFIVFTFSLFQSMVSAQPIFPDLSEDHWAYSSVITLAEDGTVKGFEDGEFKPDNTVSRAEFVKMIGKSSIKRQTEFNDINSSHWGYDYIMYSGLEGEDNNFNPDINITRYDVINLIWLRNGSKKDIIAPSIITSQGLNKDAVAWGYAYGIMVGDDGINLRLTDSLSRAEAATLIIRARNISENAEKKNFIDTVSPKTLEVLFNSVRLFDDVKYDENKTITNGEMARAAVRLGSEEFDLTYKMYKVDTTFEHVYSKDLSAIGNDCIGIEKVNKEFIDKPATLQDTLTALSFNIIRKSHSSVSYGKMGNYYRDIAKIENAMMDICLTYSYEKGIQLYADGTLKPDKPITLKEFACILLQLDNLIGFESETYIDSVNEKQLVKNSKIRKNISSYPDNYTEYQCILEELPNEVYSTLFADNDENNKPINSYDFSREYSFIFINMLKEMGNECEFNNKVKLRFTYYPALVCDNGNGATIRVKCEILENPDNISLHDIFKNKIELVNAPSANKGMAFYADIITGQPLTDIYMSSELSVLKQIIYISGN